MLLGLLVWFMYRTPWGEALNAVGQSRESAAIVGINSTRFYRLAFGLGGALAGAAGALVGPIYSLSPSMGLAARHPGLRHRHPGRHGLGAGRHPGRAC